MNWIKQEFGKVIGDNNEPAVNPDPQHLVWIKPGTFTMGSPKNEVDSQTDERPQTLVTISKGFWMSKYETTQAEYESVMGTNPSLFTGDTNRPVERVSWVDATNYCGKLTARDRGAGRLPAGYAYRLPTEAEWEYAARAGTTTRYSFGDDLGYTTLGDYACYSRNSYTTTKPSGVSIESSDRYYTTHSVGQKQPNAWGLYDLSGNVWEWCQDWYKDSLPGGSVIDPVGRPAGSYRVIRGGSWDNVGRLCRAAYRSRSSPGNLSDGIGFRSVLASGQ